MEHLDKIRDDHREAAKQAIDQIEARLQRAKEHRDQLVASRDQTDEVITRSLITVQAIDAMHEAGPYMSSYSTARDTARDFYGRASERKPDIESTLKKVGIEIVQMEAQLRTVQQFLDWTSADSRS